MNTTGFASLFVGLLVAGCGTSCADNTKTDSPVSAPAGEQPDASTATQTASANNPPLDKPGNIELDPVRRQYFAKCSRAIGKHWRTRIEKHKDDLPDGAVEVSFTINRSGKLLHVRVIENSANDLFAKIALQSIRASQFEPPPETLLVNGTFVERMRFLLK